MNYSFRLDKTYKMIKFDDSEIIFTITNDISGTQCALVDGVKINIYKFLNTQHKTIIQLD